MGPDYKQEILDWVKANYSEGIFNTVNKVLTAVVDTPTSILNGLIIRLDKNLDLTRQDIYLSRSRYIVDEILEGAENGEHRAGLIHFLATSCYIKTNPQWPLMLEFAATDSGSTKPWTLQERKQGVVEALKKNTEDFNKLMEQFLELIKEEENGNP